MSCRDRPDLVRLKVVFQRFAIEGMLSEVTESFFDSFFLTPIGGAP
jgi:hypothetical protein